MAMSLLPSIKEMPDDSSEHRNEEKSEGNNGVVNNAGAGATCALVPCDDFIEIKADTMNRSPFSSPPKEQDNDQSI